MCAGRGEGVGRPCSADDGVGTVASGNGGADDEAITESSRGDGDSTRDRIGVNGRDRVEAIGRGQLGKRTRGSGAAGGSRSVAGIGHGESAVGGGDREGHRQGSRGSLGGNGSWSREAHQAEMAAASDGRCGSSSGRGFCDDGGGESGGGDGTIGGSEGGGLAGGGEGEHTSHSLDAHQLVFTVLMTHSRTCRDSWHRRLTSVSIGISRMTHALC